MAPSSSSSASMATLVLKVTKATGLEISKELMKPIKQACKNDGSVAVTELVRCLLQVLSTSRNVGIKVRVLSIIDEMFWRCREFREEISAHIRVISKHIKLVVSGPTTAANTTHGNRTSSSSRPGGGSSSTIIAGMEADGTEAGRMINDDTLLHEKWKTMMVLWDGCYGPFLPELRGFVRYLAEGMKTPLPDMNAMLNTHAREVHRQQELSRHRIGQRCDDIVKETRQALPDITDALTEIDQIFALIFPSVHDDEVGCSGDARKRDSPNDTILPNGMGPAYATASSSSRSGHAHHDGTNSAGSNSSGNDSSSSSGRGSGNGNGNGTKHVWECDGVEIDEAMKEDDDNGGCYEFEDGGGDEETTKTKTRSIVNVDEEDEDDDEDDVAWEEEDEVDSGPPPPSLTSSSSSALATSTLAAPYTINITFAVTAQGAMTNTNL